MNLMLVLVLGLILGHSYAGYRLGFIKMAFFFTSSLALIFIARALSPLISEKMMENPAVIRYVENKLDEALDKGEDHKEPPSKNELITKDIIRKAEKSYLTPLIIRSASFLSVYLVSGLILMIIEKIFCLVAKLPVLNSLNRLGGAGVGAAKGLIIVWLFFMVLTIFMDKELPGKALRQIGESAILRELYDNNLIVKLISGFMD